MNQIWDGFLGYPLRRATLLGVRTGSMLGEETTLLLHHVIPHCYFARLLCAACHLHPLAGFNVRSGKVDQILEYLE